MAIINPRTMFKKLGDDRARMAALGITEDEMAKYYMACGFEGNSKASAFADLKARFRLSEPDAAFVKEVLGNCAPF